MPARILVVDDTPANLRLLEAKLEAEYYDVVTAENGSRALTLIAENPPDIILLDVMMPGMDGFEVCRRLRADPKTRFLPIVMVTALGDPADKMRGLDAGADDFLTKPIGDMALFARIRSLVRFKTTMDEWRMRQDSAMPFLLGDDEAAAAIDHRKAHILLVETNPRLAASIADSLAAEDHTLEVATTLAQAIDHASNARVEVVITELVLGEEDGLRLVPALRSRPETRAIPVLLISDSSDSERLIKGLDIGASDYVIKPVEANELVARVRLQVRRHRYQEWLRQNHQKNLSMALTDSLTGLYNRRYGLRHFENLLHRLEENHKPLAVLACDLDHFKAINDRYGHWAGDKVLQQLARRLIANVRPIDMVARFGGEEFVILLPDTEGTDAMHIAERICHRIADEPMIIDDATGQSVPVTISIGVAATRGQIDGEILLKMADAALYRAKNNGRNQAMADPTIFLAA